MFIHRDLTKHHNIDDVVDEFAREHPRLMELLNLLNNEEKNCLNIVVLHNYACS